MSHGGDDTEACCILGICCRRGGKKQAKVLADSLAASTSDSADRVQGPYLSADTLLNTYQLIPLDLLTERPEFAELLNYELKGYLERRGIEIKEPTD